MTGLKFNIIKKATPMEKTKLETAVANFQETLESYAITLPVDSMTRIVLMGIIESDMYIEMKQANGKQN